MTNETQAPRATDDCRSGSLITIGIAAALTVPGIFLRIVEPDVAHPLEAALFGLAIVGAAFMLAWGAEVAQLDISAGLSLAFLALIAVLPEYAVSFVFAWQGGHAVDRFGDACHAPGATTDSPCSLVLANMSGANRILIGIGWAAIVFIAWYRWRKRGRRITEVRLERSHSVELSYLAIASAYSLTLPLKHSVTLVDGAILVAIFVLYTIRISGGPTEEPHLVGPSRYIGSLPRTRRRLFVVGLFLFAGAVILLCAEDFAHALVSTGQDLGISEFFLVQWVAPLASEAPELLVAGMFAWRLNTDAGLGALVSSKVNQWTLLVGTLPMVFAIASGSLHGLPIEANQREELLLTAAQSVFAVAVLASLSISVREAWTLFGLFWAQFVISAVVPDSAHGYELIALSWLYILLAAWVLLRHRGRVRALLRDGLRTPHEELHGSVTPLQGAVATGRSGNPR
jgi:cation:H+ antiporter